MLSSPYLSHQPLGRIVILIGDALLEWDDGVVGDVDVYRTDLGAALGYVAEPEAIVLLEVGQPVGLVHRVHLQPLVADEEPGACELGVLVVSPQDVADVLAHKALDALLRLVEALDILLVHRERRLLAGLERLDALRDLIVPGDVGDQVLYDGEGTHGTYVYLSPIVLLDASLAKQLGAAVDLGATRAAVGRLAVPAHRKIGGLLGLYRQHGVEHDHALNKRYLVLDLLAALRIAAEDPQLRHLAAGAEILVRHWGVGLGGHSPWIIAVAFTHAFAFASSTSDARCSGIGGISRRPMPTSPRPSFLTIKLILPSSSSGPSKSNLHCAPRRSLRSRAVLMMISEIWTRYRTSWAVCQPGLKSLDPGTLICGSRSLSASILPRPSLRESPSRIRFACSIIDSCSSCWIRYGLSPSSFFSSGSSTRPISCSTSPSSISAECTLSSRYAAAPSPALRPKTSRSESELPPRRFAPCSPPATSPAAKRPGTLEAAVSGWILIPPIV